MITLYLDKCQCRYEKEINTLKKYLKTHDRELTIRKTQFDPVAKAEAEELLIKMPFVYNNETKAGMTLYFIDNETIKGII